MELRFSARRQGPGPRLLWLTALLAGASGGLRAQWINVQTYPIPTAGTVAHVIVAGPDGALWFTGGTSDRIGRITTSGVVTEFAIPTAGGEPVWIAAGSDGALWFTEFLGNKIGRSTTAGAITEYPLPAANSFPAGIAAGPDGALWFTEYRGDRIGRIATTGAITEYALPPALNFPVWITAGPDGALWFTLADIVQASARIGRITTAGEITEYRLPPPSSPARGITAGPDGALWFTRPYGRIGRITTAGVITEFPLRADGLTPLAIAAGPDGALWYTKFRKIGRITTSGLTTEFPVADPATAGLTTGPDGALWYTVGTDLEPNKIGRSPACGLGLRADFANTTLDLSFALGVTSPATFVGGYYSPSGLTGLWSRSVSAIVPPASFTVPWGPGFPSLGDIGLVSTLKDSASGQFLCAEWQIVNTGGSGLTAQQAERLILDSLPKK